MAIIVNIYYSGVNGNAKRFAHRILMLTLALCFVMSNAIAEITPRYTYTNDVICTLAISNGTATCTGSIKPENSGHTASVTVTLQKYSGGWSKVTSWSHTAGAGKKASVTGTKSVDKGVKYRVVVSGTIKDAGGNVLERPSKTSDTKSY